MRQHILLANAHSIMRAVRYDKLYHFFGGCPNRIEAPYRLTLAFDTSLHRTQPPLSNTLVQKSKDPDKHIFADKTLFNTLIVKFTKSTVKQHWSNTPSCMAVSSIYANSSVIRSAYVSSLGKRCASLQLFQ